MRAKQILQGMIGVIMGASFIFSCTSEDINGTNDDVASQLTTNFITTSNEKKVEFDIKYEVPVGYKVVFDTSSS